MNVGIALAERGWLPDSAVRWGIRGLLKERLRSERLRHASHEAALGRWLGAMSRSPVALETEAANSQHYEVPAKFYRTVLGPHLKYSSAYYQDGCTDLGQAELAMLELTAQRADLADGQRILELGCGWGSMTLHMARTLPTAQITAVSNSSSQRAFILQRAAAEGLRNVTVYTADMNTFSPEGRFDRVVSIEMFEHMRNWQRLLNRIHTWLEDDGRVFVHYFAHRQYAYPFTTETSGDWMGRHFFTGGMMPSVDLIQRVRSPFKLDAYSLVDGTHYARTAQDWAENLQRRRSEVVSLFEEEMSAGEARRMAQRWLMFFHACAELFGYNNGQEWMVVHARLRSAEQQG